MCNNVTLDLLRAVQGWKLLAFRYYFSTILRNRLEYRSAIHKLEGDTPTAIDMDDLLDVSDSNILGLMIFTGENLVVEIAIASSERIGSILELLQHERLIQGLIIANFYRMGIAVPHNDFLHRLDERTLSRL